MTAVRSTGAAGPPAERLDGKAEEQGLRREASGAGSAGSSCSIWQAPLSMRPQSTACACSFRTRKGTGSRPTLWRPRLQRTRRARCEPLCLESEACLGGGLIASLGLRSNCRRGPQAITAAGRSGAFPCRT